MVAERTIVVVAGIRWSGDYLKSTVELCRELGTMHRVLFVEAPSTWRAPEAERLWRPEANRQVFVLTPPSVPPTNRLPAGRLHHTVQGLARQRVARAIDRALERLRWDPDVMVHAWNPVLSGGWVRRFGQRADVYYAYDELRACPWKSKHGRAAEDRLAASCDAVVVTSSALQERLAEHRPELVPNGVDYEAFQRPDARRCPPGIDRERPVVGYVGSIDSRVDVPLLARLARENPAWQVVVAGPVRGVDASPLDGIPNLLRLGPVSREQLPALVSAFDVGLVPFVESDFTRALCPLKIYDYLAAGIGVAATPFAPLEEVREVVRVAPDPAALAEAVRAELAAPPTRATARRRVAGEAAWPARAQAFASILERTLRAPREVPCVTLPSPAPPASSVPTPSTP